jgi:hypothetical protein
LIVARCNATPRTEEISLGKKIVRADCVLSENFLLFTSMFWVSLDRFTIHEQNAFSSKEVFVEEAY